MLSFSLLPLIKFAFVSFVPSGEFARKVSSFFLSKNGTILRLTKCSPSTNAMNASLLLFLIVGNGVLVNIQVPENCRDHSH